MAQPVRILLQSLMDLSSLQWILLLLCSMLIGMSKTGIGGVGLMVVPILANAFGGRPSVGLLLPILIFADIFAVSYYNRHASWKHILRLIPWAFVGIILATLVGKNLSDLNFNRILAILILGGIGILIWKESRSRGHDKSVPKSQGFAATLGLTGGFATMMGNAAGPVMSLYLLSMRLPKNRYIGTAAWFFFIVNISKVPLHIWYWKTISLETFKLNLLMIPVIALGAFLGIILVKLIPDKIYRYVIIFTTLLSALLLL